jgi:hypothetical protein
MRIFSSILAKIFPSAHPSVTTAGNAPAPTSAAVPTAASQPVNVEKILGERSAGHAETLNWHTSIVDLMKPLNLDSSPAARKELATELHYAGDMNDSATMNIWLRKQVMAKLAANVGNVSADLQWTVPCSPATSSSVTTTRDRCLTRGVDMSRIEFVTSLLTQVPLPGPDEMPPADVPPPPPPPPLEIPPQRLPEIREPDLPGEHVPISDGPSAAIAACHVIGAVQSGHRALTAC